ncbi:MAG: gamma-glutamylcyclotransferase [Planctomycetota bacterium]|nr:MAG: gamma-glutamylcyclotransferase [Planctomycetota bacterium]
MTKLFIYGTLKRGYSRSAALDDQQFVSPARTLAYYRLFDTGAYPALVDAVPGVAVEGELWEVDDGCLARLDQIEDVPRLFRRQPVALAEPPDVSDAETYLYQLDAADLRDCGARWP